MTKTNDTRDRILEAAMARIKHYGYSKTTMSEIAKDCDMSAGNIYRFFKSKIDIAEAMAVAFSEETFEVFERIVRKTTSASARLHEMFDFGLRSSFEKLDRDAKILEVAEVLSRDRPEFSNRQLAKERVFMVRILEDGVKSGEFASSEDLHFLAEMIQSALMKFQYPQLFSRLSLPQLLREYNGVMDLVLAGLRQGVRTPEMVNAE